MFGSNYYKGDDPLECVMEECLRLDDTKIAHMEYGTIVLQTYDLRAMIAKNHSFWSGHADHKLDHPLTAAERVRDPYMGWSSAQLLQTRRENQVKEWEQQLIDIGRRLTKLSDQHAHLTKRQKEAMTFVAEKQKVLNEAERA